MAPSMQDRRSAEVLRAATHNPWRPELWPYRVVFTRAGSYHGRFISSSYTFATIDEARAFIPLARPFMPHGSRAHITVADGGPRGWNKTGRWLTVK